jgi:hypothetical protein
LLLVTEKIYIPYINIIKGNVGKGDLNLNKINDESNNLLYKSTVPSTSTEEG